MRFTHRSGGSWHAPPAVQFQSSTLPLSVKRTEMCGEGLSGGEMDIGGRLRNAPDHAPRRQSARRSPRRPGRPACRARYRPGTTPIASGARPKLLQGEMDRRRVGLVGGGVAGAHHGAEMVRPAQMGDLRPQDSGRPCWKRRPAARRRQPPGRPPRRAWAGGGPGAVAEAGVEQIARMFPAVAEHQGEALAQGDADAGDGVLGASRRACRTRRTLRSGRR